MDTAKLYKALTILGIFVVLFLALYNLEDYPLAWFDEGSHLHVPKTLLLYGEYADYSSDGFRYYGPTVGVGPTVLLPIAGVFKLFGFGIIQARLVISVYLLLAVFLFYKLALWMGDTPRFALIASALLVTTKAINLIEWGRQVLGEVPAIAFMTAGVLLWFKRWEKPGWARLSLVGLLFGLAVITKYQFLLVIGAMLGISWLLDIFYYRSASHLHFILPGVITATCFLLWQAFLVLYLGPATAAENFALMRTATEGAALVFSPPLMRQSLVELVEKRVFMGALALVGIYSLLRLWKNRDLRSQQWSILLSAIGFNYLWFVVASIGWPRYAFPGFFFSALLVTRFFDDCLDGLNLRKNPKWELIRSSIQKLHLGALRYALAGWLALMIILPVPQMFSEILNPMTNWPNEISHYLDQNIPRDVLIETWEQEMGILTDHTYHYPTHNYLALAVNHIWLDGPPPYEAYDFVQREKPPYILIGQFARWAMLYPMEYLYEHYDLIEIIGYYELYQIKSES